MRCQFLCFFFGIVIPWVCYVQTNYAICAKTCWDGERPIGRPKSAFNNMHVYCMHAYSCQQWPDILVSNRHEYLTHEFQNDHDFFVSYGEYTPSTIIFFPLIHVIKYCGLLFALYVHFFYNWNFFIQPLTQLPCNREYSSCSLKYISENDSDRLGACASGCLWHKYRAVCGCTIKEFYYVKGCYVPPPEHKGRRLKLLDNIQCQIEGEII